MYRSPKSPPPFQVLSSLLRKTDVQPAIIWSAFPLFDVQRGFHTVNKCFVGLGLTCQRSIFGGHFIDFWVSKGLLPRRKGKERALMSCYQITPYTSFALCQIHSLGVILGAALDV